MVFLPGVMACKTYVNKILILQKRTLRLLYFVDWHDHAIPLFLEANVLPITFLYYESVSTLMRDINNNKAPANISNLFQKTSYTIHDRLGLEMSAFLVFMRYTSVSSVLIKSLNFCVFSCNLKGFLLV